jgi:hypothetical protein
MASLQNIRNRNRKLSEETKLKISKANKGNVWGVFLGIKVRNYTILQVKENIQKRQNKE